MNHHFLPHGNCLLWNWPLLILYIAGNMGTMFAYAGIPVILLRARSAIDLASPLIRLFALFILLCGGGHAITVLLIWKAWYWFGATWDCGTAIASWACLIHIRGRMDAYLALAAAPVNYAAAIRETRTLRERILELEKRIDARRRGSQED